MKPLENEYVVVADTIYKLIKNIMAKIKGNRDGINNRNESYQIPGIGKNILRKKAIQLYKQGKLNKFGVTKITINEEEYLRDIPDKSKKDNINRK